MATPPESARRGLQGGVLALVAVGLIVLLGAVYFLFLRGDGEPEIETLPAPPPATTTPLPEPTESPGRPRRGPVETFELFAAKDPFEPLVSEAEGGAGAAGPTGEQPTDGQATDGEPTEPGTQPDGQTTNGGTGTGTTGTTGTTDGTRADTRDVDGRRVKLVDIFTRNGAKQAQVQVDGTVYTVRPGDRFADNFELLSIEGQCGTFLFGDDQFTLCEGQEILK